jgi:hypothetical protein
MGYLAVPWFSFIVSLNMEKFTVVSSYIFQCGAFQDLLMNRRKYHGGSPQKVLPIPVRVDVDIGYNTPGPPFECHICVKAFDTKNVLAQHIQAHHKGSCHVCMYCNKVCGQKNDLIRHIRTHTGEQPYACDVCGQRFNRKNNMKVHRFTVHSAHFPK